MSEPQAGLSAYLMARVQEVQRNLGQEPTSAQQADARFADVLDSMGMVEFLALVADDLGIQPELIERSVGRQFGTVAELASRLQDAGVSALLPSRPSAKPVRAYPPVALRPCGWLTGAAVQFPETIEPASSINQRLGRAAGWLETRAGIKQRGTWGNQDPLSAATVAGQEALERAEVRASNVGTLLVVSEAPPL